MATTTNYGWTTPDDTALVKDGAAAIRTLGSSVDTTTKNLNPSTTLGDIEYRSSTANVNTRLPLGTAGQVLKVNSGATAPEWATDASGMTNPMTTTGDTIYSSSGSTPARLGIGTTGQVLTVSGGIPSWATPAGGGGKVLQVVQGTLTTNASTSGGTYVDTGLTVSITPSSATSRIYVTATLPEIGLTASGSSTSSAFGIQLVRTSTALQSGVIGTFAGASSANREIYAPFNFSYLDSPATTSSTTYKVQMVVNTGTTVTTYNSGTKIGSIVVMEIGA
jgi:hypothetical protein